MNPVETPAETRDDVIRAVVQAIHSQTGRRIDGLEVDCDGEIITVRGKATTYYLWQLAFGAARSASRKVGGLLLDYQIQAVPTPVID
jgi:hypothetical protein